MKVSFLLVFVVALGACTPEETEFDLDKIKGAWHCSEKSNSEEGELLNYQISITPIGKNTCKISNYMGEQVTVEASVSEDWNITIEKQKKDKITYWGDGTVNLKKNTIQLNMSSQYGNTIVLIKADCNKPQS